MTVSPEADVRTFYDDSADTYSGIMDADIELPVYTDLLHRLSDRIADQPGTLVDTSCGPGHVLLRYHEQFDLTRPLISWHHDAHENHFDAS